MRREAFVDARPERSHYVQRCRVSTMVRPKSGMRPPLSGVAD